MSMDKKVELILKRDRKIIEQTVNETVLKMKMAGLLKENRKTVTEKLEELLRNYKTFKKIQGKEKTAELVKRMDEALESIIDDPYYSVIEYFYFEGYTRENRGHLQHNGDNYQQEQNTIAEEAGAAAILG